VYKFILNHLIFQAFQNKSAKALDKYIKYGNIEYYRPEYAESLRIA
jgi:hypothetical protein